jgi:hypothetical protein
MAPLDLTPTIDWGTPPPQPLVPPACPYGRHGYALAHLCDQAERLRVVEAEHGWSETGVSRSRQVAQRVLLHAWLAYHAGQPVADLPALFDALRPWLLAPVAHG